MDEDVETPHEDLESPEIGPSAGLDAILDRAKERLAALEAAGNGRVVLGQTSATLGERPQSEAEPPPVEDFRYLQGQVLRHRQTGEYVVVSDIGLQPRPWHYVSDGKRWAGTVRQPVALLRTRRQGTKAILAATLLQRYEIVDPATGQPKVEGGDG